MPDKQRGGKREGSGRKAKDPTSTINFRVPTAKVDYLKPLVRQYIKKLLDPKEAPASDLKPVAKPTTPKSKNEPPKRFNLAEELEKLRNQKD